MGMTHISAEIRHTPYNVLSNTERFLNCIHTEWKVRDAFKGSAPIRCPAAEIILKFRSEEWSGGKNMSCFWPVSRNCHVPSGDYYELVPVVQTETDESFKCAGKYGYLNISMTTEKPVDDHMKWSKAPETVAKWTEMRLFSEHLWHLWPLWLKSKGKKNLKFCVRVNALLLEATMSRCVAQDPRKSCVKCEVL